MAIFGNTSSYTSSNTTVSTQTATDSYNQSAVRTNNLSDVGNVTISGVQGGSPSSFFPIILVAVGALFLFYYFKRKH